MSGRDKPIDVGDDGDLFDDLYTPSDDDPAVHRQLENSD